MEYPTIRVDPLDQPVIATADDALSAKQATVAAKYYEDPFVDCFAQTPQRRMVQPIIKRGTHARVACMDRAIVSFGQLHQEKQIVVLGAGMDTSYLRSVNGLLSVKPTAWFEVDHPSVILKKTKIMTRFSSKMNITVEPLGMDCLVKSSSSNTCCHCIGHDLRVSPSQLMKKLIAKGFNIKIPALFVLECVQMYLPEDASRNLLKELSKACQHASVVVYDPIAQYDAFGEVMEKHLVSAGMAAAHTSLLQTRTLDQQLCKLTDCGFEIARGCDMWWAYETILTKEQQRHASQVEFLDELEEWKLLMQHYCLAVGSSEASGYCQVGPSSPLGFIEGKCSVSRNKSNGHD